ncbi:GAF and ANTAR domain-containing protein [Kribbella jiaozuonensis]|uniref:GAF and ANTAR domain-containing protein n=1 Tax=Kribbella jiaozuonensis TaxID=2575441 RepID=A0A4U3M0M5_9ACTN|nr:GAF and ANTAR domain-containing protein [Kribbella jiaozuonensis]TKK82218.1 GAF and ANTAR domain-containing protein [Kribbella jiaozuonensis]
MSAPDADRSAAALAMLTGDLYMAPDLDTLLEQTLRFVSVAITCDCAAIVLWPGHGVERWRVTGSDSRAARAEYIRYEPGEGMATVRSQPVMVGDTDAEVATELGLHSVMSSVIRARNHDIGVLDVYACERDAFRPSDQALAGALATHIAVAISTVTTADTLVRAIDAHTAIGQAVGILMERFDIGPDAAMVLLRRQSQDHNVKLRAVAADVVSAHRPAVRWSQRSAGLPG